MQKALQSPRPLKNNFVMSLFMSLGLSLALIPNLTNAQSYPNRTVKMVVPLTQDLILGCTMLDINRATQPDVAGDIGDPALRLPQKNPQSPYPAAS